MISSKVTPLNNYETFQYCLICNKELTIGNSVTTFVSTHCYNVFGNGLKKMIICVSFVEIN